jgi:thiamine kinase-like enzyme
MDDASLSATPDASQPPGGDLGRIVQQLVPVLGETEREPEPLEGGITNRNYRIRMGGSEYVIRVPGKDTNLLGIDRAAEAAANEAAAAIGVAPAVAATLADPPAIVTEFIAGRGMESEELREGKALADVAGSLRAMHDGVTIPSVFNSFRVVEDYAATARDRGGEIPAAYDDALARAAEIEAVLDGPEHDPVPCHNDLLAANFIWDERRVRIVDWEYAGMGDRYFDLANFAINNGLDEPQQENLLVAYFGEPGPEERLAGGDRGPEGRLAALRVMAFMSDFREAMWGVVQTVASELDFDFVGYANEHFDRMAATAAAPEFSQALEAVRGG